MRTKTFFKVKFMAKYSIFLILRPHFQNSFVPFFSMFSVLTSNLEHKKAIKTEHQCKTSEKLALENFFFQSKFTAKLRTYFKILRQHFQNRFFSIFSYFLC